MRNDMDRYVLPAFMFGLVLLQAVLLALEVWLKAWWGVAFVGVMLVVTIINWVRVMR